MVTCPVVCLCRQRRSHEVDVHWLRTVLRHLLLWGDVSRWGGLCIRGDPELNRKLTAVQCGGNGEAELIGPTGHLERAAWVRAGGRVREGGAAAAAGGAWEAVSWRMREGDGVCLSEGLWEGGVLGHVWLVLLKRVPKARQHCVLGVELAVPWYQNRRQH